MARRLSDASGKVDVEIFPGAGHAFHADYAAQLPSPRRPTTCGPS